MPKLPTVLALPPSLNEVLAWFVLLPAHEQVACLRRADEWASAEAAAEYDYFQWWLAQLEEEEDRALFDFRDYAEWKPLSNRLHDVFQGALCVRRADASMIRVLAEVARGLRRRARDCQDLAEDPKRYDHDVHRLRDKAQAYNHAAELLETVLLGPT